MPQYAVIIYAPTDAVDSPATSSDEPTVHDRHAEELIESGEMVAAFALHPAASAVSIRGGEVTDGPYVETRELIAGLYVIEAENLASALELAQRNPINRQGGGVEVREVEGGYLAEHDR